MTTTWHSVDVWRKGYEKDGPEWRAHCSCGWVGRDRPTRRAADEDADAHAIAER